MNPIVADLLQKAASENRDVQEEGILQIAMLIEKFSQPGDLHEAYQEIMPKDLLRVSLSVAELNELIQELAILLNSPKMTPSMLWALGKSSSHTALELLLTWLHRQSVFTEDASWQVLVAIDNFVTLDEDGKLNPKTRSAIHQFDTVEVLQLLIRSDTPKVRTLAERLIARIQESN